MSGHGKKRMAAVTVIVAALLSLVPFVWLCFYVHPVNDDYFYVIERLDMNWWQSFVYSYMNWSGRFFATLVSCANPMFWTHSVVPLRVLSCVVVVLFALVPFVAFKILMGKYLCNTRIAALAALFFLLYISQCSKVSELFYWFSSVSAFTVPCMLSLLLLAILPKKGRWWMLSQCMAAFVLQGGNEVLTVIMLCVTAFVAFEYKEKRLWIVALFSLMGLLTVLLCPGNAVRMSGRLSENPYLWTAVVSMGQTFLWFVAWLPALLLATFIYVPLAGMKIARLDVFNVKMRHYVAFFVITVFLAHIPPTLGLSSVMTGRTANTLLYFFIIFYFFGVQIVLHKHKDRVSELLENKWSMNVMLCGLFCFLLMVPFSIEGAVATAYVDSVSGRAAAYDSKMNGRKALAAAHRNDSVTVVFKPLGVTSRMLFVKDLETSADGIFCNSYCVYHGLKCKVRVSDDNVTFMSNYDTLFKMAKRVR